MNSYELWPNDLYRRFVFAFRNDLRPVQSSRVSSGSFLQDIDVRHPRGQE